MQIGAEVLREAIELRLIYFVWIFSKLCIEDVQMLPGESTTLLAGKFMGISLLQFPNPLFS